MSKRTSISTLFPQNPCTIQINAIPFAATEPATPLSNAHQGGFFFVSQDPEGNEIVAKPEINKEQVVTMQSLSNHQVIVKLSLSIPNIGELLRKMFSPMSTKT